MATRKKAPIAKPPFEGFQPDRDFAGRQFIGSRKMQEDFYAFADVSEKGAPAMSEILVALGDGLGAHIGGNLASYFVVSEFIKAYKKSNLSTPWRLRVSLDTANDNLKTLSHRVAWDRAPMGSTLVALAATPEALYWVSVGDSPLYLYRDGLLERLNADHSLAPLLEDRVRNGLLTKEEAANHPDRHILQSACMGQPLSMVDLRVEPYVLQKGDIVINSSDGIHTLDHDQLQQLLSHGHTTSAAKLADALMFAVRCADNPRQDNITIAVLKVP